MEGKGGPGTLARKSRIVVCRLDCSVHFVDGNNVPGPRPQTCLRPMERIAAPGPDLRRSGLYFGVCPLSDAGPFSRAAKILPFLDCGALLHPGPALRVP